MPNFIIKTTDIIDMKYHFLNDVGPIRIEIQSSVAQTILKKPEDPNMVIIQVDVIEKSTNSNLEFSIQTLSPVELQESMTEEEIQEQVMPLVLTSVAEKIKMITGAMETPRLSLPPIQQMRSK